MSARWQPTWSWRASLIWALLGPTFVLLLEVESALALLDGLGVLPGQLRGWQTLVAGAVLAMVLAAQLSAALSHRVGAARGEVSARRRQSEDKGIKGITERTPAPAIEKSQSHDTSTSTSTPARMRRDFRPTRSLMRLAEKVKTDPDEISGARRIHKRFGLEPSWAFQQLDENLGLPAARRLTREAQLSAARWAGHMTALVFAVAAFLASYGLSFSVSDSAHGVLETLWSFFGLTALLALLATGQYLAAGVAGGAVVLNEEQFYPHVETLLELHRFDLYRALDIQSPRDSSEEQNGQITAWRLGSGRLSFEQNATGNDSDVQQQVAGLAEMLRGPELVAYDGFVSWEAGDDQVELAFARTPVLDSGYAQLQVNGSGTASHAPFDITADSEGVTLIKVRASVNAPVGEGAARTTFGFRRRPDARQDAPELWFEISQRGRFIQLLRVKAPRPSSQQKSL